jgi:sigma-B regulation protein RsbU (phosphoserine phosphatase)
MNSYGVKRALFGTLAGRAVVIGVAIRVVVFAAGLLLGRVPGFLAVIDTVASLALAAGVVYFVYQLAVLTKRHLLWRVRRKLILSYVFIGFVPATLIVLFFLCCGFLLFYNFGSYLVQSRLRAVGEQARFLAQSTALEIQRSGGQDVAAIIGRRQVNAVDEFAGMSIAVVPMKRICAARPASGPAGPEPGAAVAGPWAHVTPPSTIPGWIPCEGFSGVLAYSRGLVSSIAKEDGLALRAVVFPDSRRPGYAVVVDLPVGADVRAQLRRDTGVSITSLVVVRDAEDNVKPLAGRDPGQLRAAGAIPAATVPAATGWLSNIPSLIEYSDWNSGVHGTIIVTTELKIGELYERISSGPGLVSRNFGQALLLALFIIGGLFIVIEALALAAGLALAKSITGSVHELFTGTELVRHGDFTHKIAVKAQDQLGELAQSFNSMTASIEDLLREAAEKKRLEEELRIAREIQMSLLPQGPLSMPGLSVSALCVPAREVGGDYYDFLPLDDNRLGVLIADVSGKGTSAALYMAELKGLMLSLSRIYTSPRELMMILNKIIANNLDARSFITMTYAVLDLSAKTMTYARAGHTPLMCVAGRNGSVPLSARHTQILAPDGLVLGLKLDDGAMFDRLLIEQTIPLHPGDLYVLFTDGISEAMNADDDCFGEGRLATLLEEHADLPAEELRERILRDVEAFAAGTPQHDDMTMILLKVDAVENIHHGGMEERRVHV